MSLDHHSGANRQPSPETEKLLKMIQDQYEGKMKRAYPGGRIAPDDDGQLAYMIAADHKRGLIALNFTKPLEWLAIPPHQARELAATLLAKAREIELTEHSRLAPV